MALIPVAAALTGLFIWGEVEAGKKNTAENKAKEWKSFEPRLDHAFNKYKRHFAKGEGGLRFQVQQSVDGFELVAR
ncbi:hypothetical protein B7453_28210 [Pseudomonas sp. IB20]|uniref:hypothetical protein n=1 Tax=Pseudomonas sp. IB20 TaxID=1702250 RepID=UPI000BA08CC7|nr:hypothetical protein [Pseudomonas sp. IB20]OZO01201.1 hypothetical protein B7453_28210 [Pseudomonas sp. IB20]